MGRRLVRRLTATLVAVPLIVVGGPWAFTLGMAASRTKTVETVPEGDVALVLGAGVYPSGNPTPYLAARLDLAYELFRQGKVKVLLVSGDNREQNYNEPEAMRRYLVDKGVPADKIVEDFAGLDTYDSCVRAKRIFGVHEVTLVTQGYHLPRAITTCRLVGVDAHGVGDEDRDRNWTWLYGHIRELGANLKMIRDVVTARDPILGEPEDSVRVALGR